MPADVEPAVVGSHVGVPDGWINIGGSVGTAVGARVVRPSVGSTAGAGEDGLELDDNAVGKEVVGSDEEGEAVGLSDGEALGATVGSEVSGDCVGEKVSSGTVGGSVLGAAHRAVEGPAVETAGDGARESPVVVGDGAGRLVALTQHARALLPSPVLPAWNRQHCPCSLACMS